MSIDKSSDQYTRAMAKLKKVTSENKYCAVGSFVEIAKGSKLDVNEFVAAVKEDGFEVINHNYPTGIVQLVADIRIPTVAAMVSVSYSPYLSQLSLKKYLLTIMNVVCHSGEESIDCRYSISRDTIEQLFSTLFKERADAKGTGNYTLSLRTAAALHALIKNDSDLTEVYHLAKKTLGIYLKEERGSIKGLHRKELEDNSTFNHFHRLAAVILNEGNRHVGE